MSNIVRLPTGNATVTTDEYFGGCPHCGRTDGYLNFGYEHWFVCDAHRFRWCAGVNLFSDNGEKPTQQQLARQYRAWSFKIVDPVLPTLAG